MKNGGTLWHEYALLAGLGTRCRLCGTTQSGCARCVHVLLYLTDERPCMLDPFPRVAHLHRSLPNWQGGYLAGRAQADQQELTTLLELTT